jgi:GNAT superfamily N-acetyltransferase
MESSIKFNLRLATEEDVPALHALIEASVRGLQAGDYTQAQIEGALGTVLGLDTQLIRDRTYFVAEIEEQIALASGAEAPVFFASPDVGVETPTYQPGINPGPTDHRSDNESLASRLAGCGGWSKRKTLFGADRGPGREPELLDAATDAAKVRAIFVHPDYARMGLGSLILATVEAAAQEAGFTRYEMGSTLTGVPLYRLKGYVEVERIGVPLWNGEALPVVKMVK